MNRPASMLSGTDSHELTKPSSSDSMPRNMIGPRTNPPATLAGTLTSEVEPKVSMETGAVARLAAAVTPTCSGSGPGRKARPRVSGRARTSSPATAPNDSWKLTSKTLLGLAESSQAPGASQSSQPSLGREAITASRPTMPATPARTMEGEAPVSTTYVATTGTSRAVRTRRGMASRVKANDHMLHRRTTFSPDTAMMCRSPLRRKSSIVCCSTPSSSPSTIP